MGDRRARGKAASSTTEAAVPPPVVEPPVAETPRPDTEAQQPKRTRILGLDGPRGLACLAVLVSHVGGHYSPETTYSSGLQLTAQALIFFFTLSGFLLYLPFARAMFGRKARPDTGSYLIRRFLRVFPAYLFIFLITNFVMQAVFLQNAAVADEPFTDRGLGMMTDPLQLILNFTLLQSFFPDYLQTGINPSWSLSLEFCFYFTLPALAALAFILLRRTSLPPALIAVLPPAVLIVLGTSGKLFANYLIPGSGTTDPLLLTWGPNWVAVVGRSFWALADNFAFGMLAAVIFVMIDINLITGFLAKRMRWILFFAMIPTGVVGLALIVTNSSFQTSAMALISAMLIVFIIAPLARGENTKLAQAADWRPLKYVGTVSLSVYLWHYPVLIMVGRFGWTGPDTFPGLAWNVVLVASVSVLFSSISYKFVEYPALNYARKFKGSKKTVNV